MTRRGFDAGQIVVSAESGFAGMTLAETAIGRGRNLIVIAVQRGEEMMLAPRGNEKVQVDDILHPARTHGRPQGGRGACRTLIPGPERWRQAAPARPQRREPGGAGEWIRTTDLLITNQLLYH